MAMTTFSRKSLPLRENGMRVNELNVLRLKYFRKTKSSCKVQGHQSVAETQSTGLSGHEGNNTNVARIFSGIVENINTRNMN